MRAATARLLAAALLLGVPAVLFGCEPELGPCDELSATRIVYDETGSPALLGQALMVQSCGFGAFCHASGIRDENRYGTHAGLEYDLRLIDAQASLGENADADALAAARARLERDHRRAFNQRHVIWSVVESGRMPVGGGVGAEVQSAAPTYQQLDASGALVPIDGLDTARGRAALRNWLACGLPIVESSEPTGEAPSALGYVVDALEVEPIGANWEDIYTRLIEPRCASAPCHGVAARGDLDLRGLRESYDAILSAPAARGDCESTGLTLIEPGAPDRSLFVDKLAGVDASGAPVCGDPMPVGRSRVTDASLANIRAWVASGALFE